jgi:hypothetical protein
VIRLPITITNQSTLSPTRDEQQWLSTFAHPRRLLVIGGKTSLWRFDESVVADSLATLKRRAALEGGSVLAVTSPRTTPALVAAAQGALGERAVVTNDSPRYGALLGGADEIHVTGDSVSMLSDAIATGKPVGLIPLEREILGSIIRWGGEVRGRHFRIRDLEKFWTDLRLRGLVGTVEEPRCGQLDIVPMEVAVAAVQRLLEESVPAAQVRPPSAAQPATGAAAA